MVHGHLARENAIIIPLIFTDFTQIFVGSIHEKSIFCGSIKKRNIPITVEFSLA